MFVKRGQRHMIKFIIQSIKDAFVDFFCPTKSFKKIIQFNAKEANNQQLTNLTKGEKGKNEKNDIG